MKIYKVPVFKSETGLKELKKCGTILCRKSLFGVKEVATKDELSTLDNSQIEKIGRDIYATDKSTFLNFIHKRSIEQDGMIFYTLSRDLIENNEASKEEVEEYIDNFEQSDYFNALKERDISIQNISHYKVIK